MKPNTLKVLPCNDCTKQFSTVKGRLYHMQKCHNFTSKVKQIDPAKCQTCSHCGHKCQTLSGLWKHQKKVHPELQKMPDKSFLCFYCDHMFSTHSNRLTHMKSKHAHMIGINTVKTLKCLYCPKMFATHSGRIRHERQCSGHKKNHTCRVTSEVSDLGIAPTYGEPSEVLEDGMTPSCNETFKVPKQDFIYNCRTPSSPTRNCRRRSIMTMATPEIQTPRRAKRVLLLAKKIVCYKNKIICAERKKNTRLQNKIRTLYQLIQHLRKENSISDTVADSLLVNIESFQNNEYFPC